jgi:cobalt-zinc-cadmium resistance protein CzcA
MAGAVSSTAQEYKSISIDEAIEIALIVDPSILLADLKIAQKEKFSQTGTLHQPTQISFSGEEFNFGGVSGIQSLNIQQSFNLPKVSTASKEYFLAQMETASNQKVLSKKELIKNVELAYYTLVIAKREAEISKDIEIVYRNSYDRSSLEFQGGESNKSPMLSTYPLLKKAEINLDHANHEVEVSREIFNLWIGKQNEYDVTDGEKIQLKSEINNSSIINPHLDVYDYEKEEIIKSIEIQKSNLLPQLNAAARLQSLNGDLLYFGYQLGISIPIDRRAYKRKIEASKMSIELVDIEKNIKEKEIERRTLRLRNHLSHLRSKIQFYDSELIPSITEQVSFTKDAYQLGEGSYLEYLMSLEKFNEMRLEKLQLIKDFYFSSIELKYWTEVN